MHKFTSIKREATLGTVEISLIFNEYQKSNSPYQVIKKLTLKVFSFFLFLLCLVEKVLSRYQRDIIGFSRKGYFYC